MKPGKNHSSWSLQVSCCTPRRQVCSTPCLVQEESVRDDAHALQVAAAATTLRTARLSMQSTQMKYHRSLSRSLQLLILSIHLLSVKSDSMDKILRNCASLSSANVLGIAGRHLLLQERESKQQVRRQPLLGWLRHCQCLKVRKQGKHQPKQGEGCSQRF